MVTSELPGRPVHFGTSKYVRFWLKVETGAERELENAGKRGPGGEEKEWTDCVADDLRLFGITGEWSTAAIDPGVVQRSTRRGL